MNGLESYRESVHGVCARVLRHSQDAEDATQEVMLEAAREALRLRDPMRFEAWLFQVALHTALDFARRRRARARHEGKVRPSGPEPGDGRIEALQAALSKLPRDERRLLVDHFFHQKTLRELAAPAKCSEVAVWKRIDRAKKRLRDALVLAGAGAALALLDSRAFATESAGLAKGAVAAAIAVSAAVLLAAAAASRAGERPSASPPLAAPSAREAVAGTFVPVGGRAAESPSSLGEASDPVRAPSTRRPYPYQYPPPHWSPGAASALDALRSKRVTIDMFDEPMAAFLDEISRQSGLRIEVAPGAPECMLSFKVREIVADGALRLMLNPRGLGFELSADGTIVIDRQERLTRKLEDEAGAVRGVLDSLADVRRRLSEGWNGLDYEFPETALERKLRQTDVVSRQEDRTLAARLETLREESKVNIVLDAAVPPGIQKKLYEDRALPVQGGNVESHLRQISGELNLGFHVTSEQVVLLTTREGAEQSRKAREDEVAWRAECRARLDRRIEGPLPASMPELVEALERLTELRVRVSEKVWDSRADFTIPAGVTVREAIDRVARAGGFRWAADPHLFIVD